MYFFINELSFIGQAKDVYEAEKFIAELYSVIKEIQPLQGDKPVQTHSNIANEKICSDLTFHDWLQDKIKSTNNNNRTLATLLLKILRKGPFIDQQRILNSYQCYFERKDAHFTSLSGAAYYQGILISLQNSPSFSDDIVKVKFGHEKQELKNIEITNLIKINQLKKIRRHYQPSPKHRQRGEQGIKGTQMDLSNEDAQIALDTGIPYGRQIYSYYNEKYYEFQSDNAGGFHGYPILEKNVPHKVIKQFKKKSYVITELVD
jgi:hypothetical protein